MRTQEIKIYTLEDLSGNARETAIEQIRTSGGYLDWEWYEDIISDFETALFEETTFNASETLFNGFYCQGDGASFTGEFENVYDALKVIMSALSSQELGLLHENIKHLSICRLSNWYVHKNSVAAEAERYGSTYDEDGYEIDAPYIDKWLSSMIPKIEKAINAWKDARCEEIYARLQAEYEDLTSDETIARFCNDNAIEFYADGTIYRGDEA